MSATFTATLADEKEDVVYYHSGATPTYRKVATDHSRQGNFTSIPVIDLSNVDSPDLDDRKAIAGQLYEACSTAGFFYITNHGVSTATQEESIFATLKRFFDLPLSTKMTAHLHKNPAIRGYEPPLETQLDPRTSGDLKEAFTIGDCVLDPDQDYRKKTGHAPPAHIKNPQNIWPSQTPWFREAMYSYYAAIYPLALKVVRLFALAFDLEESAFDDIFTFPIWGLRALHYPPLLPHSDPSSPTTGLGAHADFSWITLVLQDTVPGLEVLNSNGVWIAAPPREGTFVCNVGQYLEKQTNGMFPGTAHRTVLDSVLLDAGSGAEVDVLECCLREGEERPEAVRVGELYVRRVLAARKRHPTSVRLRGVPEGEWRYEVLYGE
ncbi:2og-Fe oxygenase family protein [Teratosphaeria destructans]|uniref:2og-Fe oxygenase family protein n=1 Tax=Teratosphaeria destructans TaxID=418781 RepID=A0A9W7STL2_9PEZI|nr:2og-Fe oxygenase family protein [Teratosphaeria destructans]